MMLLLSFYVNVVSLSLRASVDSVETASARHTESKLSSALAYTQLLRHRPIFAISTKVDSSRSRQKHRFAK